MSDIYCLVHKKQLKDCCALKYCDSCGAKLNSYPEVWYGWIFLAGLIAGWVLCAYR